MDPAEVVTWERRPQLREPVLIAAFEGWNDAGDASSTAARYLASTWGAKDFASIDPEEFYDFTETRPKVRLEGGITRRIDWPTNTFAAGRVLGADRDIAFLHGVEPQLKWRTFARAVTGVAQELGCTMVITLGALVSSVPHSRAVPIMGTAADPELATRLNLQRSRYEGPTGIVGVLHDSCSRAGIATASLWASVPHYVSQTPSPKAALALVERAAGLVGATVDAADLRASAEEYLTQIDTLVADNEEAADYVRTLEEAADQEEAEAEDEPTQPLQFRGADALAEEAERFLREQRDR